MKASLSEYMKALSGDQFSILEEIIQHKYRKFMSFFDLTIFISTIKLESLTSLESPFRVISQREKSE